MKTSVCSDLKSSVCALHKTSGEEIQNITANHFSFLFVCQDIKAHSVNNIFAMSGPIQTVSNDRKQSAYINLLHLKGLEEWRQK